MERWRSTLKKFYVDMGILSNNMKSTSFEHLKWYSGAWPYTVASIIDQALNIDIITELDLVPTLEIFI